MDDSVLETGFEASPNNLETFWMPFTWNRKFKADPMMIGGAKGMHYYDLQGRESPDAPAGRWGVSAGHRRERRANSPARCLQQPPQRRGAGRAGRSRPAWHSRRYALRCSPRT